MGFFVHDSSIVDENVIIGEGTKVWYFCHIQSGARIGENCSFGQNVNISNNVHVGNEVKIQNNVSVYEGVEIGDGVFLGPSCVFTNDLTPRSRYPKHHKYVRTVIENNASIGANATIVCGNTIGCYAMVAAGAVVTENVKAYALMCGVPAKQTGWVCKCGQKLDKVYSCPDCRRRYQLVDGNLQSII